MPNLDLVRKEKLSSFRLIAIGTWRTTYDPSVYGAMKLPMDETLRYMAEFREKTGRRITVTHMMAKAVAGVLEKMPDANAVLRYNRIYLRSDIAVFFQVALKDDETGEIDLSGATIHHANTKPLLEIVDEFKQTVDKVRSKKDKQLEGTRSMFKRIPPFLLNWVLDAVGFLAFTLNLDPKYTGLPKDPFGSVMVTNVGSLGLEEAYVPLVPYSKVPLLLATCAVQKEAAVDPETDEIKVVRTMKVCATFDHRIMDGSHAAVMSKVLKAWFTDPYKHFGPIPDEREAKSEEAPDEEPASPEEAAPVPA